MSVRPALIAVCCGCSVLTNLDTLGQDASAGCGSPGFICLEAEGGIVVAPMAIESDATASSGEDVLAGGDNSGTITFALDLAQSGTYFLWCRVIAPDAASDSFFVTFDTQAAIIDDASWRNGVNTWSPTWQWNELNQSGAIVSVQLAAGQHALVFGGREAGLKIDRFIMTTNAAFVPS